MRFRLFTDSSVRIKTFFRSIHLSVRIRCMLLIGLSTSLHWVCTSKKKGVEVGPSTKIEDVNYFLVGYSLESFGGYLFRLCKSVTNLSIVLTSIT